MTFKIDTAIDEQINNTIACPNLGFCIYNWLTPDLRIKLIDIHKTNYKTGFKHFLQGLRYEYGIEIEIDLQKALEYYTLGSEENDSYALYRLYTIHRIESIKFNINNRNKQFEMYYLFKSMAFSDSAIFFNNDTIYNMDIVYEIAVHLDVDDPQLDKTNQLFIYMKPKIKSEEELRFVEAMVLIKFNTTEDDLTIGISILHDLADNSKYLEAAYKLACMYSKSLDKYIKQKDSTEADKYFQICYKNKYFKSYNDYGVFLFNENRLDEAYTILKEGYEQGNHRCIFLFYDLFMSKFEFKECEIKKLVDILDLILIDILTGNVFSIFEYFYVRKTLKKHFNITNLDPKYEEEIINTINNVFKEPKVLEQNFSKGIVETEFLLSYGFLNYIGVCGTLDYDLALKFLKESFIKSENHSYKRFCYSYIFKIKNKKFKNSIDGEKKIAKTKEKLFKIYHEYLDKGSLDDFSSSYFYFIAKIFENGWGTKLDLLASYCFYYHASKAKTKYLATGSIISYYRRYKAKNKILQENYIKISKECDEYKIKQLSKVDDDENVLHLL